MMITESLPNGMF
nr:translational initiation factor 1 [Silene olgiana]YP_010829249.1 translational initiation factor 1 [Silene graminifolia]YP_010829417.1 translational initiation factor 1 [Silene alexandrae]WFF47111.1 translational initiation factor 1 [Silene olgiana]WFF47613.1 translational initiation factor 1 [Silene graminifolia]WFF48117.1 translational initiation factor 1 [Silene alexandrae]